MTKPRGKIAWNFETTIGNWSLLRNYIVPDSKC